MYIREKKLTKIHVDELFTQSWVAKLNASDMILMDIFDIGRNHFENLVCGEMYMLRNGGKLTRDD